MNKEGKVTYVWFLSLTDQQRGSANGWERWRTGGEMNGGEWRTCWDGRRGADV